MEELERHADRLDRDGDPGTLMFADMDHFKAVNDAMGHEAGDRVLVAAAELLRRIVRPSDLVARLGGDEFAVWLNGVDHMTAAERADALREALPREIAELLGPDAPRVGMSIGIACRRGGGHEPLDSVIRRADMAMYEVKRHGRGHWRVSLEDPT
jgi:diguanylate cyclase (GGDEF)-like protein